MTMFTLQYELPKYCDVAVSGGADSMAAAYFLRAAGKLRNIIHINHQTGKFANQAEQLVNDYFGKCVTTIDPTQSSHKKSKTESPEEYFRRIRYKAFIDFMMRNDAGVENTIPLVTAHTLDDCVEEYIINKFIRMQDFKFIPYQREYPQKILRDAASVTKTFTIIRPFRTWKKSDILGYCAKNNIPYLDDPTNFDGSNLRSRIRLNLIPELIKLNPGLYKCLRKMIEKECEVLDGTSSRKGKQLELYKALKQVDAVYGKHELI